jgi:hypothetical protein
MIWGSTVSPIPPYPKGERREPCLMGAGDSRGLLRELPMSFLQKERATLLEATEASSLGSRTRIKDARLGSQHPELVTHCREHRWSPWAQSTLHLERQRNLSSEVESTEKSQAAREQKLHLCGQRTIPVQQN